MGLALIRDYATKLAASYTCFAAVLVFFLQTLYRDYIKSIVNLALTEEYSYLLVSLFTVFATVYLSLKFVGFSYGIRLSKLSASLAGFSTSMILYVLSTQNVEYSIQLQGASLSLLFVSLILFIYEPVAPSDVVPLLTPMLLIPLPAGLVDAVTPLLSKLVGRAAAFITGAEYVESTYAYLKVETQVGTYDFVVEAVCSGIVTLSSIVSVFPVLAYMITAGTVSARRKLAASILSLGAGLGIGLTGNLIRVLLVVYVARYFNPQIALTVFHYSPSIVYSALSTIISFYIAFKYANLRYVLPRPLVASKRLSLAPWETISGTILVLIAIVSVIYVVLAHTTTTDLQSRLTVHTKSVEHFVENPLLLLSNSDVRVVYNIRDSYLARILGAFNVHRIRVMVDGDVYSGYIELVDTPARLHTWQLCLTLQGYNVLASWSSYNGVHQVNYILLEKSNLQYVLVYVLLPVMVMTPGYETVIYARVSLLRPCSDLDMCIDKITSTLLKLVPRSEDVPVGTNYVEPFLLATYILIGTLLGYLALISLSVIVSKLKSKVA